MDANRHRASDSTDPTLKQHCVKNDLGPAECAERLNKGKKLIFIFWGSKQRKNIEKIARNRSNVGLRSSRPDQKDPQDRRGYFRKIWAWKTGKKTEQIKIFSGFFRDFPLDLTQIPLNPRTNGWAPPAESVGIEPGTVELATMESAGTNGTGNWNRNE